MALKRIDIKITFRCNNHCAFCVRDDDRTGSQDMPRSEFYRLLRSNKKWKADAVVLTGGEPSLHNEFLALVRLAKEQGYRVQVQSNGRIFFYEDVCLKAVREGVDEFSLSLHGPTAKIHDGLTRVPGSFEQCVQGLRNLVQLRAMVTTNTVILASNYRQLSGLVRLLADIGIVSFQFSYPHISGTMAGEGRRLLVKKTIVAPYVREAVGLGLKLGLRPSVEALPRCFLGQYGQYSSDVKIPWTKIYDGRRQVLNECSLKTSDKIKADVCQGCAHDHVCAGPWKEYPRMFGWDEFRPCLK